MTNGREIPDIQDFPDAARQAPAVPAAWSEPVTFAAEVTVDSEGIDNGFEDPRFREITNIGAEDTAADDTDAFGPITDTGLKDPEAGADLPGEHDIIRGVPHSADTTTLRDATSVISVWHPADVTADVGGVPDATPLSRVLPPDEEGPNDDDSISGSDRAAQHFDDLESLWGATPAASPADSGDVPPELPPLVTTGEGGPNRGEALKDILTYIDGIDPETQIQAQIKVLDVYDEEAIRGFMIDNDVTNREEAVGRLANTVNPATRDADNAEGDDVYSIRQGVINDALEAAQDEYGDRLEEVGLELTTDGDAIGLELVDAGYFTEAVGQMPTGDPDLDAALQVQVQEFLPHAVAGVALAVIADNMDAAQAATGGAFPQGGLMVTPEGRVLTAGLIENASTLAANLEAHDVLDEVVTAVRQLGFAAGEDLLTEWAVGVQTEAIGQVARPVGQDRLLTSDDWQPVYRYAHHLMQIAPNARLTMAVQRALTADIDDALADPAPTNADAEALQAYEQRVSLLREARNRITDIFNR